MPQLFLTMPAFFRLPFALLHTISHRAVILTPPIQAVLRARTISTKPGRLEGKVAVITGASSGIGRAIALTYSAEGAHIVNASLDETSKTDEEKSITTHDLVAKNGGKAIFVQTDVTKPESVESAVQKAVRDFERIDVFVNNAG